MPDVPLKTASSKNHLGVCRHCHTRFRTTERESKFCCSGCRFVFHLLHKRGLGDFYHYGESLSPAGNFVFHERDYDWLTALQRAAEEGREFAEVTLEVQGISCAGCIWLLEALFTEHAGASSCRVNSSTGMMHLRWRSGAADLAAYARDVQRFGYLLGPPQERSASAMGLLTRKLGLCGFLAMNAMLFASPRYFGMEPQEALQALFDVVAFGVATASMAIGGTYFFRRAWRALRLGRLHIDFPISLGLLLGYGGSVAAWLNDQHSLNYFDFVSVFTFLMLLGRWLQERAVEANRRRLLGLKLSPGRVRLSEGESMEATALRAGQRFTIGRNQVVPVRSRLQQREALFALNWINGEPAPRTFYAGDIVPSGARSLEEGALTFDALEDWASSQLFTLLQINAGGAWHNAGLERLMKFYLMAVIFIAFTGFFLWGWGTGEWVRAFQVLISVLVVSCPCALGVALPLLDDRASAKMQAYGVYIREGSLWAKLRHVKVLLFDKTGTVTLETLQLVNFKDIQLLSPRAQVALLHLVKRSLHPAAACLREVLLAQGVEIVESGGKVQEIPGMGLLGESPDGVWRLGRASWAVPGAEGEGSVFSFNEEKIAHFYFREELRPDAAAQMARFKSAGFPVFLLSGDETSRVRTMGQALGLPVNHVFGGLSPEGKAALVRERWRGQALMLGDGANDSLAFDAALCRGTPAVDAGLLEHKSDFYLLGRGLEGLGMLFAAAKNRRRTAALVFSFAIIYNLLAVSAALSGWMNPLMAAVIMPLSSLISIGLVLVGFRVSSSTGH